MALHRLASSDNTVLRDESGRCRLGQRRIRVSRWSDDSRVSGPNSGPVFEQDDVE
jgi:hypothetical protein